MPSCYFHAEDWWGVSCCMLASHMLPQDTVVCSLAESVCMLLPSVVCIVCRFPYIYFFAAVAVYLVCDPFFSASSVSRQTHRALVFLWWLAVTCSGRIRPLQHAFDGPPSTLYYLHLHLGLPHFLFIQSGRTLPSADDETRKAKRE